MFIGAVADDVTGATDLSLMLSREGMRTIQIIGVPDTDIDLSGSDAVVIALKSRTILPLEAIEMSLVSARTLMAAGAEQILFKYCSTFDSTDDGNIGPVIDALLDLTGTPVTIACPSFPAAGRTVYKGHLFVGDRLLSESPLKDHPLTPMHDSDLVRVLQRQTRHPVGLIQSEIIASGSEAIRLAIGTHHAEGKRMLIVDTLKDDDLRAIGQACDGMKLVTGGSGVAMGLPENFKRAGKFTPQTPLTQMIAAPGRSAILAGSCSAATRGQVEAARAAGLPTLQLDALAFAEGGQTAEQIADWAINDTGHGIPLIYSSADPEELAQIQTLIGRHKSGTLVEGALADIAQRLQHAGFTRFVVAGGETSGAVVAALGVRALLIGPEIDPGVPWTRSVAGPDLTLALKSGNFGSDDFFIKAWTMLETETADA
ncbi:3-oxo-tetronate kinase [Phyllobacterium myrsinacearum]|uniref:3-oxo-tetronate kinase n=1 Tax=Phyllobacterium myrsinacearum TaxID=28101 RepID=A0A839ESM7_9HYPH|nr:3-oxo-tetronate kinase [Phyllobacterium myrsinacearum]MBA8879610.1 uncharacterized protein YgbK (DUF1537 family) [Phyllobacterium myrsinacearum]